MSLGPGPFFATIFGVTEKPIPLATSPVAAYKAPDAQSSWTAIAINGYIQKYNERLAAINDAINNAYGAASTLNKLSPTEYMYNTVRDTLESYRVCGVYAITAYNDCLAATRDSLAASCRQLGVSLPRHGKTEGMKPVYAFGMVVPDGSHAILE